MENKKLDVLKKYFGYNEFRRGQGEVIDNILLGRDALCIMPTGAGKSVCYQVPALIFEGITIVVSPLISLMKDQVQFLVGAGVRAAYVNSSLSPQVIEKVFARIKACVYKIIYVAPERLLNFSFIDAIRDLDISQVVIDEAHCISKWGHDFRPSYLGITEFIDNLPRRPRISAFTATATEQVKGDICNLLKLNNPFISVSSFDRPNLFFDVRKPKRKDAELLSILKGKIDESGIIYCATRKTVEEVCELLVDSGYTATRYHAGLDNEERANNQDDFIYDRKRIMVATNAFGMGIDKGNVSFVIHYNMPKDMESYYQEAGRAGRDGNNADCILLFGEGDVATNKYLIEHSASETDNSKNMYELLYKMVDYCKTESCLRHYILGYFGEIGGETCGKCANCVNNNYVSVDVSRQADVIINCIRHAPTLLGAAAITATLRGGKDKLVVERKLFNVPEYGALKECKRAYISAIIDKMLEFGILERHGLVYPTIKISKNYIDGLIPLTVFMRVKKAKGEKVQEPVKANTGGLFDILKDVRTYIAKQERVPAYIVFSDATLLDMTEKMPTTREEFLRVSGVGEVKATRYSVPFLSAIKTYKQTQPKP